MKRNSLELLKYGSDVESEKEPGPTLEEYQLPQLPPPPSSYHKCVTALQDINPKIQEALTSPSRVRYTVIHKQTNAFLMQGSLHKIEISQAHTGQVMTYKRKLDARRSLQKGGSILASTALAKSKKKRKNAAESVLIKAQKAIVSAENKAKRELHEREVQARKDKKARRILIQESQVLRSFIHPDTWIPIRDPKKQPTPAETAALSAPRSLHNTAALTEQEWNKVQSNNPNIFTNIPINPEVLQQEHKFQVRHQGLQHVRIDIEEEEEKEGEKIVSPPPSIISDNSIINQADFI
jgi:hypothetical protein